MFHEVQRRTVLLCISPKAVELHSERGDVQEGIFGWALANLSDFGAILGTREAVGGVPDHFAIIFEDPKSAQNLLHHKGRPLRGVDCSEYGLLVSSSFFHNL